LAQVDQTGLDVTDLALLQDGLPQRPNPRLAQALI
jgi:hypothetical protein